MKTNSVTLHLQEMNPTLRSIVNIFVSAIIAVLIFVLSNNIIISGINQQFEQDSMLIQTNINSLVKRYEQNLSSINSFVISNNDLTKRQFDKYLDTLKINEDYPSMKYIHFAQLVKSKDMNKFYDDLKNEYSQAGLLNAKLNNQLELYKNNIDASYADHYIVRYVRGGENSSRFIGMEIPKSSLNFPSSLDEKTFHSSSHTALRDDNHKGALIALNLLSYKEPEFKEGEGNSLSSFGATGAVIKLNENFFSPVKNGLEYLNFQIFSASDMNNIYTSLSKDEKNSHLLKSNNHKFFHSSDFMIGNSKYTINTFASKFPPNFGNNYIAYIFTIFSFFCSFLIIHFGFFKKMDEKKISRKVTKQVFALATQANTDQLTGLFNRRYFFKDLQSKIKDKPKSHMFLFFIDLDGFKGVNDNLGHAAGDELLQQYTYRIQGIEAIKSFTAYRVGGDEFLILIEQINYQKQLSHDDIKKFADTVLRLTDDPFIIHEEKCYLSQSIGLAEYPIDGATPEDLFKNSDMAMYEAKKSGKNCYVFYSDDLSERIKAKNHMLGLLLKSIEKDNFQLDFQPKMAKINGVYKIHGAEALMRWRPEQLGNVSPAVFISLAEEAGLMEKIDNWLIHEVGRSFQQWKAQGIDDMVLSINVSAKQFSNDALPDFFKTVLEHYHVKPENIIIEITESATMKEPTRAKKILEKFRSYGFGVSIDDFGTGYSSISYLRQFPATEIKIDKSFTDDIMVDSHDRIIIEGIADMSQKLNLAVVLEGVETPEQVKWIEDAIQNRAIIQGYFFSKPLSMQKFIDFAKLNAE